jgi:threonine dehydrogenase-like Zn-dependent dehydrogenase
MKAVAVFPGSKHSAHLVELIEPTISPFEVLVKVLKVGVDGTDFKIDSGLYGEAPKSSSYLIIGHEAVGVVEEVGSEVSGFKRGELVVPTVRRPCKENCLNCRNHEYDFCLTSNYKERGIKAFHGFMGEYFIEKPEYLIKIPSKFKKIGFLLEPLSVVEKTISQIFKIQERLTWQPQNALVLGAGPIGILATMKLRSRGIKTYTGATRSQESIKAQLVESTGARYINLKEDSVEEFSKEIGNLDIIVEATGNSTVAFQALNALGTNGILTLTGISGGNKKLEICSDCLNLKIVLGNKVMFGTVNASRADFEAGVQDFEEFEAMWPGLLSRMITKKFSLTEFKESLSKDREAIKTVLEISG